VPEVKLVLLQLHLRPEEELQKESIFFCFCRFRCYRIYFVFVVSGLATAKGASSVDSDFFSVEGELLSALNFSKLRHCCLLLYFVHKPIPS